MLQQHFQMPSRDVAAAAAQTPGRIKSHDNVTSSGSLELCCHGEDAHTHTQTQKPIDSLHPAPLQRKLLDMMCEHVYRCRADGKHSLSGAVPALASRPSASFSWDGLQDEVEGGSRSTTPPAHMQVSA